MYAGLSVEAGNVWDRRGDMSFASARKDASLFFGLDTFLGPAWLAAGFDSRGRHAFYLVPGARLLGPTASGQPAAGGQVLDLGEHQRGLVLGRE